ncbi:Dyp-type peroxidase [Stigmatella erecta]|uniref:Dyp-type peroxidase family n=1 Tax=Stigmatella erecta TaxID=83460 RepID=A0A1I0GNX4_9BACT|nr:peroxidase [Stigmatella erecta]SET72977.1 Dyp-type peroxidase family [Stigmatella erecta]
MTAAAFLLLKIEQAGPARAWLQEILRGELTTAEEIPREQRERRHACLNTAFTWQGLKALGLDEKSLQTFPYEFRQGMAGRAHVLGDTGPGAPEHWDFGGKRPGGPPPEDIHLLLMLYARSEDILRTMLSRQRERLVAQGFRELYCQRATHLREEKDGQIFFREHFGFRDSLSQPVIRGFMKPSRDSDEYDSPIAAGEFILGHENEYQEKPLSPSVPAALDPQARLGPAEAPDRKDLGLNGTYLVLRKLEQDVDGLQAFLEKNKALAPSGCGDDEKRKEWLKAKLLGRWPNGAALKPGQYEAPDLGAQPPSNAFRYAQEDEGGLGCPVTSHVRRTNPRDALAPTPDLSLKVSRRHRILRRGIAYDTSREEGGPPSSGRGLIFIALNANIGRQFEFIQQSWMNNEKTGRLYNEQDPVASGHDRGMMTLPAKPLRRCVMNLQSFVTMKGGGYFFLPGVKALEFLAHLTPLAARQDS